VKQIHERERKIITKRQALQPIIILSTFLTSWDKGMWERRRAKERHDILAAEVTRINVGTYLREVCLPQNCEMGECQLIIGSERMLILDALIG